MAVFTLQFKCSLVCRLHFGSQIRGRKYSLCFNQGYHVWPWPNTKCRTDAEGGSLWGLQERVDLVSLKCGAEAGSRDPFPLSLHQVCHCIFPGSVLPRTAAQTAVGGLWGSTWNGFSRGPEATASLGRVPREAALGDTQKWWEGPGETEWEIFLPSDSSWVKPSEVLVVWPIGDMAPQSWVADSTWQPK